MPILKTVYVKVSQLIPHNQPAIFKIKEPLTPQFQMQINHTKLEEKLYEVTLTVKIVAKRGQLEAYELVVAQAGEFEVEIKEADKGAFLYALEAECSSALLPMIRSHVSALTQAAGFGAFQIPELDFKAIHAQRIADIKKREVLSRHGERKEAAAAVKPDPAAGAGAAAVEPGEEYTTPPTEAPNGDVRYAELRL